MKTGTTYKRAEAFALLLIGEPKSGKTTLAMSFPKPYIMDLDKNLSGALRHHGDKMGEFWFDDVDDVEKPEKKWSEACNRIVEACKTEGPETIIIDGLTIMAEYLQYHILANTAKDSNKGKLIIAGEECMQMNHWTPFQNLMKRLVMTCKASGKKLVFICHEQTIESDSGAIKGYRPMIQGSLKHNLAGFFTDVWRCEAGVKAQKPYWAVRFAPKNMMQIGNSLQIKDIDFDVTGKQCDKIWEYLDKHFTK